MLLHSSLPSELETAVVDLLDASGLLLRRLRAESNPDELTWSQTLTLSRLARYGAATTAELARAEGVKPQSMGATLAVLESEALVERREHPTDGRQVLFDLTDKARENRAHSVRLRRTWLRDAISELEPDEQQTMIRAAALLMRIAAS